MVHTSMSLARPKLCGEEPDHPKDQKDNSADQERGSHLAVVYAPLLCKVAPPSRFLIFGQKRIANKSK